MGSGGAVATGREGRAGRRAGEKHPRRRIVDAIFYVVRTGCAWRRLPKDFAPWPTVYWYFTWWHDGGTVERLHDALRDRVRVADGRSVEPSAGLIDSQSVHTADTVPVSTRGFDAGKKVKGRKRFIVTDTLGLLLSVHVVAASIQARDGAKRSLLWTRLDHPSIQKVWADQGFAERTFAWMTAHRRLARDYETDPARSETMIRWAMIGIMVRRITRGCPVKRRGPRRLPRTAP